MLKREDGASFADLAADLFLNQRIVSTTATARSTATTAERTELLTTVVMVTWAPDAAPAAASGASADKPPALAPMATQT